MQDSPDNDADQKLRRYAEARRKQAHGDWEPHPASLRALQAEARRVWGQPKPPRRKLFSFAVWLPCAAAVASVLILGWGWQVHRRKSIDEVAVNRQNAPASTKESLGRRTLEASEGMYNRERAQAPANSESKFGVNDIAQSPLQPAPGTVALGIAAASPAPPSGAAPQVAAPAAAPPVVGKESRLAQSSRQLVKRASPAEPAPGRRAELLDSYRAGAGESSPPGLRFQRDRSASAKASIDGSRLRTDLAPATPSMGDPPGANSRAKPVATAFASPKLPAIQNAAAAKPAFQIMDSFELRRDGNRLTIIDGDGSIYTGAVTASAISPGAAGGGGFGGFGGGGGFSPTADQRKSVNGPVGNASQGVPFQAEGTNISLHIPVEITGFIAGNIQESDLSQISPPVAESLALGYAAPAAPASGTGAAVAPPATVPLSSAKDSVREGENSIQSASPPPAAPAPAHKTELAKPPPAPTVIVGSIVLGKTNTLELRATSATTGP